MTVTIGAPVIFEKCVRFQANIFFLPPLLANSKVNEDHF